MIRNRSKATLVEAYSTIYNQLKTAGLQPKFQICDNECPKAFHRFLKERDVQLQLVPLYDRQTNPAKKAIDTYKSHFLLGLASLPPNFPLHLWDCMVEPATITLNLLQPFKLNPMSSVYAQLYCMFGYN